MTTSQNYINHVAVLVDASSSMLDDGKHKSVVKVVDNLVSHLAQKSKDLDQETRVSVYTFAYNVECIIFDKDVLRLPSIEQYYKPYGMTSLIDATMKSQEDLAQTAQMYGDHAFLTYVVTDGQENYSKNRPYDLSAKLNSLPENWTVACFVPDQRGVKYAKASGFSTDNIAMWDATSAAGVEKVGETIRNATDTFMTMRASGVRGSKSLLSMSAETVNPQAIRDAKLKPINKKTYDLLDVDEAAPIREWVQSKGHEYLIGKAFYQLSKRETIQAQKNIAIMRKSSKTFYTGPEARTLLGLPMEDVRVSPDFNPLFDVFVQSTSVNRKLVPGTKLLLLK